ncbi:hypothetical protein DBV15_10104 [Temnothorax longispinosus]|uniref:Uncharacterized protein n=1 Tax=Temnothorax longispinosus TaxID=300112 RepID=A0A4V6RG09_9HYME|nr:hypothetical protein DBV15_10104 [Temnothorax longispinosus]
METIEEIAKVDGQIIRIEIISLTFKRKVQEEEEEKNDDDDDDDDDDGEVHCLEDEGKGSKGSEQQQAVTKDESERVAVRGVVSGDSRSEAKTAEWLEGRRNDTNKEKEEKQKRRRKKKNDDAAGREPARLARQVQRARMQRYEATNSHNYTWIAELRPDFDTFRARERKHTSSRREILATYRCKRPFLQVTPRQTRNTRMCAIKLR